MCQKNQINFIQTRDINKPKKGFLQKCTCIVNNNDLRKCKKQIVRIKTG